MKKIVTLILLCFLLAFNTQAQKRDSVSRSATIQGLKIAYITKKLSLTSEEAQKFWPVYFIYVEDLKKARIQNREDILGMEEEMLNIRKKYKTDFKKILLTDERVNNLFSAEHDFGNEVRKELQKRSQMRNGHKPS